MSLTKARNQMILGAPVNILDYGADPTGSTDSAAAIQAALDSGSLNVLVPEGTYIIRSSLTPAANQTIIFVGEIKIDPTLLIGSVPVSIISVIRDNVTLINPRLDGSSDAIVDTGGQSGVYSVVAGYGSGGNDNLRIYGGTIKNGIHNLIQGGSRGLIIDGTTLSSAGEHLVYINQTDGDGGTTGTQASILNCILNAPYQDASHTEGHYFQIRNTGRVLIDNCYCYGAGSLGSSAPTIAVLFENSLSLTVTNSSFIDLTNKVLWQDSGDALFSNCVFNVLAGVSVLNMLRTAGAGTVTFDGCDFTKFYTIDSQPTKLKFIDCAIETPTPFTFVADVDFKGCSFNGTNSTTFISVTAGYAAIEGCTFTGTGLTVAVDTVASARIQANYFPDIASGSNHINITGTGSGNVQVLDNSLPAAVSTSTIKTGASVITKTVIVGNYLPLGVIEDLSTIAVITGNATV